MQFDELDSRMRIYETAHDHCVLPGIHMVARIDGRGFTRLTREVHEFEAPYDTRFRDHMIATSQYLMSCGFRVRYAYTQSDEINLVLDRDEDAFARKLRKLDSLLAGEASAAFSLSLGARAAFDCRVSQLPDLDRVVAYLRWRSEDAHRNALNGHCYWLLRGQGLSADTATGRLNGLSVGQKNELLFQEGGLNFNDLPAWQRRGIGLYWESYEKAGVNPKTGESVTTTRRRVKVDLELPMRDAYDAFTRDLVGEGA